MKGAAPLGGTEAERQSTALPAGVGAAKLRRGTANDRPAKPGWRERGGHTPPPPRTLYLADGERKHIDASGPALAVQNARGQTRRFPITRIARIVSAPCADWTGRALQLCQTHAIPITWLDSHGEATGTLFPARPQQRSLHQMLEIVFESNASKDAFRIWQQHRRMYVLHTWGKSAGRRIPPKEWENLRRAWVYCQQTPAHLPQQMRSLCAAWVAAQIAQEHIAPDYIGHQGQNIPLLDVLTELIWAHLNLFTGALSDQTDETATQVRLMESWQTRHASEVLAHIHSLHRWAALQMRHI